VDNFRTRVDSGGSSSDADVRTLLPRTEDLAKTMVCRALYVAI